MSDPLVESIRELVSVLSKPRPTIPADKQLWTIEDIAEYLGVSRRTATDAYACRPDFPAAIVLPTEGSVLAKRRWKMVEVIKWAERRQDKKAA